MHCTCRSFPCSQIQCSQSKEKLISHKCKISTWTRPAINKCLPAAVCIKQFVSSQSSSISASTSSAQISAVISKELAAATLCLYSGQCPKLRQKIHAALLPPLPTHVCQRPIFVLHCLLSIAGFQCVESDHQLLYLRPCTTQRTTCCIILANTCFQLT